MTVSFSFLKSSSLKLMSSDLKYLLHLSLKSFTDHIPNPRTLLFIPWRFRSGLSTILSDPASHNAWWFQHLHGWFLQHPELSASCPALVQWPCSLLALSFPFPRPCPELILNLHPLCVSFHSDHSLWSLYFCPQIPRIQQLFKPLASTIPWPDHIFPAPFAPHVITFPPVSFSSVVTTLYSLPCTQPWCFALISFLLSSRGQVPATVNYNFPSFLHTISSLWAKLAVPNISRS